LFCFVSDTVLKLFFKTKRSTVHELLRISINKDWIFFVEQRFDQKMCSHEGHAGGLFGDESLKGESLSLFK